MTLRLGVKSLHCCMVSNINTSMRKNVSAEGGPNRNWSVCVGGGGGEEGGGAGIHAHASPTVSGSPCNYLFEA